MMSKSERYDLSHLYQLCFGEVYDPKIGENEFEKSSPFYIYSTPSDNNKPIESDEQDMNFSQGIEIHTSHTFRNDMTKALKTLFIVDSEEKQKSIPCAENSNVIEYVCLTKNNASNAALVLNDVLIPLITSIDPNTSRYISRFTSTVIHASQQFSEGTRFELPQIKCGLTRIEAEDCDSLDDLEIFAVRWSNIVATILDKEISKVPEDASPDAELDFWRKRNIRLSDLLVQIEHPTARECLKMLRSSGSPVVPKVEEKFSELKRLALEAEDNAKFLSTLERNFQLISLGSLSEIAETIPRLFDSIRMIWIVSRHYNRDERMAPLLEKIANQLIERIKKHVNIEALFRNEISDSIFEVGIARKILESWRNMYMAVRAQIEEGGAGQRRWEFDRGRLFEKTDYMAGVCSELLATLSTMDQFNRFLGPELSSITGENSSVDDVVEQVQKLPEIIEKVNYDIFDRENSDKYSETVRNFQRRVQEIERYAGISIEKAFQKLRSASRAFQLVENFKKIGSRPSIHQIIEKRYSDILDQFDIELAQIEKNFQKRRHNPPKIICFKKISGSILWAEALYQKVKKPIVRFRAHQDGLLSSHFGNTIKHRYLRFARLIDGYKDTLYSTWHGSVENMISQSLNQPILYLYQDRAKSKIKSESSSYALWFNFESNFSSKILQSTGEAKILAKIGYRVPDSVLVSTLQENVYHKYTMSLDKMTKICNEITSSLLPIEKQILQKQLNELEHTLKPALTTLNWTSQRISAFVMTANRALEKFKSIRTEIRKHSLVIEKVVESIEKSCLISESAFSTKNYSSQSLSMFCGTFESMVNENLKALVERYSSIRPLLVKVEMVVMESDSGSAENLKEYYRFWEKRIYNAIAKMIVRSISTFANMFTLCSSTKPLCKIDVVLHQGDFILTPSFEQIYMSINKCIRAIPESAKRFVRWMKESCIESPAQLQSDGVNESIFRYTFYEDIAESAIVSNALIRFNYTLHNCYMRIDEYTSFWHHFESVTNLWDPRRQAYMEQLLEQNCSLQSLRERIENLIRLQTCFSCFDSEANLNQLHSLRASTQGIFELDSSEINASFCEQIKVWNEDFGHILHILSKKKMDAFMLKIQSLKKDFDLQPRSLEELKLILNAVKETKNINMRMEVEYRDIQERYETLEHFSSIVPKEEFESALSLNDLWNEIIYKGKELDFKLLKIKNKYSNTTKDESENLSIIVNTLNGDVKRAFGQESSNFDLERNFKQISEWSEKVLGLQTKIYALNDTEELLGLEVTTYPYLCGVETELQTFRAILDVHQKFRDFVMKQYTKHLIDFEAREAERFIQGIEREYLSLKKCESTEKYYEALQKNIEDFKIYIPLITSLQNEAIKPRHWEKLSIATRKNIDSSGLTLKTIFSLELHNISEKVETIIEQAKKEFVG